MSKNYRSEDITSSNNCTFDWRSFVTEVWIQYRDRVSNNIQYSDFQNSCKIYTSQPNKWKTTCLAREMGLRRCRSLGLARMVTVLETRLPPNPPPPPRWATIVRLSQLSSSAGSSLVCTDSSHNIVAGHWRRGCLVLARWGVRPLPQYCRSDITEASDTRQQFCVILNSIFVDLFWFILAFFHFNVLKWHT